MICSHLRSMWRRLSFWVGIKPWRKTTVSKNFSNRLRNILKRDFDLASPNAAWCTDMTYIWTYSDREIQFTGELYKEITEK